MASRPLIKEALNLLNSCGLKLEKQTIFSNLVLVCTITSIFLICFDSFLECFFNWKGLKSMEDLAIAIGIYQILIKILSVIYHRNKIIDVIEAMKKFWPISKYGSELQNEISSLHETFKKSVKLFLIVIIITGSLYIIQALLGSVRKLPFRSYLLSDLDKSPEYELMFILDIIFIPVACTALIGCDFLFISLVVNITCELKLIKKGFENVPIYPKVKGDNNETLNELKKIIEHHDLTLKSIKKIEGVYSMLLLNIFFFNMVCMCIGLLCIIVSSGLQSVAKYGLYVVCYVNQLFFYCIAGSFLTTESANVSFAIYNTEWWIKTQPKLRRAYVMVIGRANKPEKLTAGGMFNLDLDSFAKVTKAALSFFTLVKALYGEK